MCESTDVKRATAVSEPGNPSTSWRCEPAFFAYFLCGGKESECRPAQGQREIDHRENKERPRHEPNPTTKPSPRQPKSHYLTTPITYWSFLKNTPTIQTNKQTRLRQQKKTGDKAQPCLAKSPGSTAAPAASRALKARSPAPRCKRRNHEKRIAMNKAMPNHAESAAEA